MKQSFQNHATVFCEQLGKTKTSNEAIALFRTASTFPLEKPTRPSYPTGKDTTQKQFNEYREQLDIYSKGVKLLDEKKIEIEKLKKQMNFMLLAHLRKLAGFDSIPTQFKDNLLNYINEYLSDYQEQFYKEEVEKIIKMFHIVKTGFDSTTEHNQSDS